MPCQKSVLVPRSADETFALITQPDRLRRWQVITARRPAGGRRLPVDHHSRSFRGRHLHRSGAGLLDRLVAFTGRTVLSALFTDKGESDNARTHLLHPGHAELGRPADQ